MTKLNVFRVGCVVSMLCAAAVIDARAQNFTSLASFNGGNGGDPKYMSLAQGLDGNFYGTTTYGGQITCDPSLGCGVIFKITPGGELRKLKVLESNRKEQDGTQPTATLLLATDGNFYGTTTSGGRYYNGAVFKITPGGEMTTLYSFCAQGSPCADGAGPYGGLIEGPDGNFYGTTAWGGTNSTCFRNCGTVFRITPTGNLTTLANFCTGNPCASFSPTPYGELVLGNDGNFYGTTQYGGNPGDGTVFKVTPGGILTTLHSFQGSDGGYPLGGVVLGNDGNFYGTTSAFGAYESGTVFKITPARVLTTLYNFCVQTACADGGDPFGTLIQATDGNFYGTTVGGGSQGSCGSYVACGTIFRITPAGSLTTVFQSFDNTNGFYPSAGLVQGTNGVLYGTTYAGGDLSCPGSNYGGCGAIFSFDLNLQSFAGLLHNPARIGQSFGVLGQGFTGTTAVALNGTSTNFTVVSDTFIKATVPSGATTGYVTVTTPTGVLTSNVPFRVIQ